jgi:hypothetical protein
VTTEGPALEVVVGEDDSNRIVFVLERRDGPFVTGSIAVRHDGEWIPLVGRSGIETLALNHLRDDLRDLMLKGGLLTFGDYDYEPMLTIAAVDGVFRGSIDLPSADRWEIPIGRVSRAGLERVVDAVDEAEAGSAR